MTRVDSPPVGSRRFGRFATAAIGRRCRESAGEAMKNRAFSTIGMVVGIISLLVSPLAFAQINTTPSGSFAPAFRSFFSNSIVVTNAVFEKEIFLANIPSSARKQVFFFKKDGENYLFGAVKDINNTEYDVIGGRFENTLWEVNPNYLMIYDQQQNSSGNSVPVAASESVMRMTINLFLNLGVTEMARDTVVWVKGMNRITAQSTEGKDIIVDFEGEVEAPTKASIKNGNGEEYAYVRYSYNPKSFERSIPVEFTRFHTGAPSEELGKVFTVRVRSLKMTEGHIPLAELDPLKAFNFKRIIFYSNDVMYWKGQGQRGGPQRVLTAEEAYKSMPHTVLATRKGQVVRYIIIGLLGVSTICVAVLLLKQSKRRKSNE